MSGGFVMVPDWLRQRKPTGPEVLVYINLGSYGTFNPGGGTYDECRPAVPTIAEDTDLSENTVRKALKGLADHGALLASAPRYDEKGGQLPTVYRLVFGQVVAPPQNLNPPPSTVEPGGVQKNTPPGVPKSEPNQEPSTQNQDTKSSSFDAEASPTAQTVIRGFIDWLALPEQGGVQLSRRAIGIYAKSIKQLLGEGFPEVLVKRALVLMHERGMTGRPTLLETFVVEVQARPVSAPPANGVRTFKQMDRDDDQLENLKLQAMGVVLDRHPEMKAKDARRIVEELIAAGQLDLNALSLSAATGYIDVDVITGEVKEVTGS